MKPIRKIKGFTLPEMLISISLGLFLTIMLVKVYLWQNQLHHQMDDMIFLDRNKFLAMQILANNIRATDKKIMITNNNSEIIIQERDNKKNEDIQTIYNINIDNQALRRKRLNEVSLDLVSGVDNLRADFVDKNKSIKVKLHLTAPYGMTEEVDKTVCLENYRP